MSASPEAWQLPHRSAVAELLRAFAAAADGLGARWYLFGAQAAMVWGRPRLSADVDATIEIPEGSLDHLVAALEAEGFSSRRVEDLEGFVARTRVLPLMHGATRLPIDVVLAGSALEAEFLDRAPRVDFEGSAIPVLSPEDLIVTKLLAGRPKDLEDVRGVLDERLDRLDLGRIRTLLADLDRALDRGDLVRLFEAELAARGRA